MPLTLNQRLQNKHAELKELDEAIEQRRKYLKDQEKLIADIVEAGNSELMMLTHEIAIAKKELRDLKTDIRTGAQDKVLLMRDIGQLQLQITAVAAI